MSSSILNLGSYHRSNDGKGATVVIMESSDLSSEEMCCEIHWVEFAMVEIVCKF